MYQHHHIGTYKFLLADPFISEFEVRNKRWFGELKSFIILAMLSVIKYLQSHMYHTNYAHCEHMFLCYIMVWIHFLNIFSRGRRKSRWNKWIAEQNLGGVEAGALYGGENTCQVNQNNFLSGKPHFMDFGINVSFKQSWVVLWRAVSLLSITVYACKCISTQKYLTSTSLKFIKTLKTSDYTNTLQSFKCKQTKL